MAVETKGKSIKVLREEKAILHAQAQTYVDEHEETWTAEDDVAHGQMIDDGLDLKRVIGLREANDSIAAPPKQDPSEPQRIIVDDPQEIPDGKKRTSVVPKILIRAGLDGGKPRYIERPSGTRNTIEYRAAFESALSHGTRGLTPEQMSALQSDKDPQAGYLVASEEFASGMLKNVDDLLFIRRYANIHTVREATSLGIRKRTANASTFNWSSELTLSTEDSSLAYGKKVLTPHHLTGSIKVSRDLLRRTMGTVGGIVQEEMAIDAGQVMEDGYLTGDGASSPLGVFTASADGISTSQDFATGNTTTAITADGLREAKYGLKSQYRGMGLRWLFHRDAIKMISKLKDGEGQYLWQNGITVGDPDRILGYPVDESERSPNTFTTGLYVGLLANWRYYEIADALDMEVQILTELYAETNQVGYIGRLKTDGMPTLEEAFARVTLA